MTDKLSPTQIKSFLHCRRRWGFEYLDKKRSPPSKYAQFGINGHKHLERWFKEGTPPDQQTPEGAVALSGLHHWPAPDLVQGVEIAIETETAISKYYGYQDLSIASVRVEVRRSMTYCTKVRLRDTRLVHISFTGIRNPARINL